MKRRIFAGLFAGLYFFSLPVYAENLEGQIQAINHYDGGLTEVVVQTEAGTASIIVNESTVIEASVPVNKIKNGQRIVFGSGVRSGRRGFRSPFRGISKSMRKQMGLPELPSTPDVPRGPEVPSVPKVPKPPKVKGNQGGGSGEALPEAQQAGVKRVHPEGKPTEEETDLYGRVASSKSLARATAPAAEDVTPLPKPETKEVVSVKRESSGVKLELVSADGKREEIILAPDKEVTQSLSGGDLQKNMQVTLDAAQAQEGWLARKITVRE